MKFHSIAENILSGKIKIAVLKFLLNYPTKKFSGRELSRLLRSSPSSVLETLELFSQYGIVHRARIGKTTEWTLNKQHVLAELLLPLLTLDEEALGLLNQKIKAVFPKNKNIIRVVVFGSLVKGEENPNSDIDLFILVKETKHKPAALLFVNKLNESLASLFGNSFSAVIYSVKELKNKKTLGLIKHIKEEGKIIINHGQNNSY